MAQLSMPGPQRPSRLRRALFQVHLWSGIGLSLYILAICLSGSAIVFRRELDQASCPTTAGGCEPHFVTALVEFHDKLTGGRVGLRVNGLGALAVLLICLTGAILWWRGMDHWWRGMTVRRNVAWHHLVRDLHSALGFWLVLLVLMWVLTGIYFAFPEPFNALAETAINVGVSSLAIDDAIGWIVRLHFGRAYGQEVEVLWVILGLLPTALVVTGLMMWWHRVRPRRLRR
jgi:uncharacterized iron-regulated membrane protein